MFKTNFLMCHFLVATVAGHKDYFNEEPHLAENGNVKTIHYSNTAPASISYSSAIRPMQYKKSFYYFSAPDEHFEQRHNVPIRERTRLKSANDVIEQQHQPQPQTQVYVFNEQSNNNGLLQNPPIPQLLGASDSQQQIPEVHLINYKTEAEANQVIQQVISTYNVDIPKDGRVSYGRVNQDRVNHDRVSRGKIRLDRFQAAKTPAMIFVGKPAVRDTRNKDHSSLSVNKNYAINYLPTGVDVVPGSSYIPLRRI